jgi:hypothetical protein
LNGLGEAAQRHPVYKRALKLLSDIYRKEKLPQLFCDRIGLSADYTACGTSATLVSF